MKELISILVVDDNDKIRRLFSACLPGVETLEYSTANWWQQEEGVIAFQNEVMKYVYYRFTH